MTKEYIENKLALMRKAWVTATPEMREWILTGANILKAKLHEIEEKESTPTQR